MAATNALRGISEGIGIDSDTHVVGKKVGDVFGIGKGAWGAGSIEMALVWMVSARHRVESDFVRNTRKQPGHFGFKFCIFQVFMHISPAPILERLQPCSSFATSILVPVGNAKVVNKPRNTFLKCHPRLLSSRHYQKTDAGCR
jgi:hypothetical protein